MLSFNYRDQNSATVTVTMTVPAQTVSSPLITGASATGGAFTLAPVVTSVTPNTGPITGANDIIISGKNLTGATVVKFGTGPGGGSIFTVNSPTQITVRQTNFGTPGPVDVFVTTPNGTGTGVGLFTFVKAPSPPLTASASPAAIAFGGTSALSTTGGTRTGPNSYAVTTGGANCSITGSTLTGTAAGTCTVTATRAGDETYNAGTATVDITVAKAAQTITFPAIGSKTYGAAPFSVTPTASSGLPVTIATVTPNVCTLSGNTVTIVAVGTCSIDATQAGNGNYESAPSVRQSFTVDKAMPVASITSSANPSVIGQPVTFTFSLTGAGNPPTGTLVLLIDDLYVQDLVLSGGRASYASAALSAEVHTVLFNYAGDGNYQSSYFQLNQMVNPGATTSTLTASPNPSTYGQTVILTATVVPVAPATGTPAGAVTFKNGATVLGQADMQGGTATLEVTTLGIGTHALTAAYNGNASFLTSTSAAVHRSSVSPRRRSHSRHRQGGRSLLASRLH